MEFATLRRRVLDRSISSCCCSHNTLASQGKPKEADELLMRATGFVEKAFGPDHPSLAESLGTRAFVLTKQV